MCVLRDGKTVVVIGRSPSLGSVLAARNHVGDPLPSPENAHCGGKTVRKGVLNMRFSLALLTTLAVVAGILACSPQARTELPTFVQDPSWPKPLPRQTGAWHRVGRGGRPRRPRVGAARARQLPRRDRGRGQGAGAAGAGVRPRRATSSGHGAAATRATPGFYDRMDSQRLARVDEHPHPVREHALNVDHEGNGGSAAADISC